MSVQEKFVPKTTIHKTYSKMKATSVNEHGRGVKSSEQDYLSKRFKYSTQHVLADVIVKRADVEPRRSRLGRLHGGRLGAGHAVPLGVGGLDDYRHPQEHLTAEAYAERDRVDVLELNVRDALGTMRFIVEYQPHITNLTQEIKESNLSSRVRWISLIILRKVH